MPTIAQLTLDPGSECDFTTDEPTVISTYTVGDINGTNADHNILDSEDGVTQAEVTLPCDIYCSYCEISNIKVTGPFKLYANDGTCVNGGNNNANVIFTLDSIFVGAWKDVASYQVHAPALVGWWEGANNLNDSADGNTMVCVNPKYLVGNGFEIFGGDDYPGGPASKSYKVPYAAALSFGPTDSFTIEGNFIGRSNSSLLFCRQNTDFAAMDYGLHTILNTLTIQVSGVDVITYTVPMTPFTSHFDGVLNRWVLDTCTFYAISVRYVNGTWSVTVGGVIVPPDGITGEYFPIPANTNSYGHIFGNPGYINQFTELKIYGSTWAQVIERDIRVAGAWKL